ncbi:hypothetical protein HYV22_04595 [Candidatus Gottesmanbacteria bacterium]|nr:hypothetical protein [Candidatus Gottesmanbacteria bacterium]
MFTQEFSVQPRGEFVFEFPLDMLRYDYCWPATSDDVLKIASPSIGCVIGLRRSVAYKTDFPTSGRWESFGWTVVLDSVRTRKY